MSVRSVLVEGLGALPMVPPRYFPLPVAIRLARSSSVSCLTNQTINVSMDLNVNPTKPGQSFSGIAQLPHGVGKRPVVAVFARGAKAQEAKEAGADIVGAEDLIEKIQAGQIEFTKCLATPDMMPLVSRIGKILGPRGLMPNPKMGSLTMDISNAVKKSFQGQVRIKTSKTGTVNAALGKAQMTEEQILENFYAYLKALRSIRPPNAPAGTKLFYSVTLSCSNGPGFRIDTRQDPFNE